MTPLERINAIRLPLATLLDIEFTEAEPDRVVAKLLVREELCTLGSFVHGGTIMSLADTVGAAATVINLPPDGRTTTLESKTNFIGPASAGDIIIATATPVHRGRRTQVWQTRVETADGRLVAVVVQTQIVL
ncbi:MAG: PaaI family thioesterase [Acetobacteraceae bacterium]|nr:PaaI family thioesterase [Acetobacteraceae bacterium]